MNNKGTGMNDIQNERQTRKFTVFLLSFISLMVFSCARMGSPDGGWYDETPPKVLSATPKDGATNVKTKKIKILFDEYIKIDNPSEKVIISPPQIEAADIKAAGKQIVIDLKDTLLENTTYTIDFSDAISDNNENNPMGNFTYSFSTGEVIDTLEVSGYVLEAENLEPVKGIMVGLYKETEDSIQSLPMQRISRTDGSGHFVIKGVAPGSYRIYALQDADENYYFNQKSEKIAFTDQIVVPSAKPDIRQDTVWRDSLHIETINRIGILISCLMILN
jgi:5-hydroxyisourate hydrolase-like protein (transthyretin family)